MTTVRYTTINGEVIAEKRNGVRRLYVPDPLGSTVALLDNTQAQVDTFTYWPYGEVRSSTGTTPLPFQFVGTEGYYTDGIGRTYVRARYLHTQKGRWLTQDPISFDGGDYNLYRYVNNVPVTDTDSSGLAPCPKRPPGACFWCYYQRAISLGYNPCDACSVSSRLCPGSNINCRSAMFCEPKEDCDGHNDFLCFRSCKYEKKCKYCSCSVNDDGEATCICADCPTLVLPSMLQPHRHLHSVKIGRAVLRSVKFCQRVQPALLCPS